VQCVSIAPAGVAGAPVLCESTWQTDHLRGTAGQDFDEGLFIRLPLDGDVQDIRMQGQIILPGVPTRSADFVLEWIGNQRSQR
jgi:hypothetical protein